MSGRRGRRAASDRGAVTAELAVGLVAVTVVLVAVLAAGAAAVTRIACLDAARAGARAAALGEDDGAVATAARRALGARPGDVTVARDGSWVTVTVSAPLTGVRSGPAAGVRARGESTAWVEP